MKRTGLILAVLSVLFLLWIFSGGTYDYGLNCDRCLFYEHRIQPRPFGFAVCDYPSGSREDKYLDTYKALFGHPCGHNLKKGGFGYRGGCGFTTEGALFRHRLEAIRSTFEAYKRIPDQELTKKTYALIEKLFPESTTVESFYAERRRGTEDAGPLTLMLLSHYLDKAHDVRDWEGVYSSALDGFATAPEFGSPK